MEKFYLVSSQILEFWPSVVISATTAAAMEAATAEPAPGGRRALDAIRFREHAVDTAANSGKRCLCSAQYSTGHPRPGFGRNAAKIWKVRLILPPKLSTVGEGEGSVDKGDPLDTRLRSIPVYFWLFAVFDICCTNPTTMYWMYCIDGMHWMYSILTDLLFWRYVLNVLTVLTWHTYLYCLTNYWPSMFRTLST